MPSIMKRAREDTSLHDRVESLAQAIRDKNIDAVMTHYAPDVVVYDVMSTQQVQGVAEYRKNFEKWFASIQGPIDYEMNDLRISMGENHAFCHCQSHIRGRKPNGEAADYRARVTACFQKANGQWLVSHEHVSVPMKM